MGNAIRRLMGDEMVGARFNRGHSKCEAIKVGTLLETNLDYNIFIKLKKRLEDKEHDHLRNGHYYLSMPDGSCWAYALALVGAYYSGPE